MTFSIVSFPPMALVFLSLSFLVRSITPTSSLVQILPFQQQQRQTALQKGYHTLFKRGSGNKFSGRATFYATGLGACGVTNTDSDFIVALNQPQYEANKWCGKSITVTYGGKSHDATIQDECPGCPEGGLDMSPALFKYFASEDAGVFYMSWTLNDGSGSDSSSQSPSAASPAPAPTSTYTPPAYTPPPYQPPATSTASVSAPTYAPATSQSTSSPAPATSASASSWAATPTFTPVPASKAVGNSSVPLNTSTSTTKTDDNSPAVAKGYALSSSNYGQAESAQAYEAGGNLDTLSELVLSFGSLAAASASNAISNGSD